MPGILFLLPIALPILAGVGLLHAKRQHHPRFRTLYVLLFMALCALSSLLVLLLGRGRSFTLWRFSEALSLGFSLDGLGILFGAIVTLLWFITGVYALEYMKKEQRVSSFFAFFLACFGAAMGVAFSGNFLTLFLFCELLTLLTLPLVTHSRDAKARYASKQYLFFSYAGSALALISLILLLQAAGTLDFVPGGLQQVLSPSAAQPLLLAMVLGFFGFGGKAALLPFCHWLPASCTAPTPASVFLHVAAVVNAGVLAVARLIYFGFGPHLGRGTWAQYVMILAALATILYSSSMALRQKHLKRRLTYSSICNLCYILFAFALLSPSGLAGGLIQMSSHAVVKTALTFCSGAIVYQNGRQYHSELAGIGLAMPLTMSVFTFSSLALAGLPPLPGFLGKWRIAIAAVQSGDPLCYAGIAVLLLSSLFTWLYLIPECIAAFFPPQPAPQDLAGVREPGALMRVPMLFMAALTVAFVVFYPQLSALIRGIALGI